MKNSLWILISFLMVLSLNLEAEGKTELESGAISSESQKVEKIVQTLNEALLENRTLKDDLSKKQTEIESLKAQNNLLMSQIRQIQSEIDATKRDVEVASSQVNSQKAEFEKARSEFEQEQSGFQKEKGEIERKQKEISDENDRLKNLLDNAVLKEEGEQYKILIQKAEETNRVSIEKVAKANRDREQYKKELVEQYYANGNLYFEKEDYRKAVESYKRALRINPQDPWVHHNLGIIYDFYLQDNRKAIHHYKRYLQVKSIKEDAREIRERVLHLELTKLVTPRMPLRGDFDQYQKDLKLKTTQ